MASLPPPHLSPIFARIKTGDIPGAYAAAERILRSLPNDQPLLSLTGMLACQAGDFPGGIDRLRKALVLNPKDQPTRNNLVRALIDSGDLDTALSVSNGGAHDARALRLSAYIHHQQNRYAEAIADYRKVVAAIPDDFESWNNLGNLLSGIGDGDGALVALRTAIAQRPDIMLP